MGTNLFTITFYLQKTKSKSNTVTNATNNCPLLLNILSHFKKTRSCPSKIASPRKPPKSSTPPLAALSQTKTHLCSHQTLIQSTSTSTETWISASITFTPPPRSKGIHFRYRNKFMTMNELAIGFDPVDDIDEFTPLLTGALGLEVTRSLPVSTRLNDTLADTMALVSEEESVHFNVVTELPDDCFLDSTTPRKHAITRPFEGKVFFIRLPLSCPRVKGVDILEGSITSPDVIESLEEYHPRVGAWARVHASLTTNNKCQVKPSIIKKLDADFIPADNSRIPFNMDPFTNINPLIISGDEEEDSLWFLTNERILAVKNRNIAKYKAANPDQEVPSLVRPQCVPPVVVPPVQTSTKETLLHGKHKRAVMSHRLILGSLNKRDSIVEVPDLAERFLICWETSEFESVIRDYKNSVADFCKERTQDTRDYFFRSIAETVWSNATYTLFLNGINHDRSMDEQEHNLSHDISIINFLPEDRSKKNEEYMKYLRQLGVENMEINVEEEKDKRQKIG